MISVNHISAGYTERLVLQDVTMTAGSGQFVGLIGPNGSGKTTLLRVLSGVLAPRRGEILLAGTPLQQIPRRDLAKIMACWSQDIHLDLSFAVGDIVMMGRSPYISRTGRETQEDFRVVEQAMKRADIRHLRDRRVTEISQGERQRTLIAMCLAQQPRVLLLDEPTSHLDIGHQLSILDLLRRLNRKAGVTVVAVLHDLNLAAEYCDRLVLLCQGRIEAQGPPAQVLTAERIRRTYGAAVVVEENPVSGKPHIVLSAGFESASPSSEQTQESCGGIDEWHR